MPLKATAKTKSKNGNGVNLKNYKTRVVISRAKVKAEGQKYLHNWSLITGRKGEK